jgi:PAS domain-containing protein
MSGADQQLGAHCLLTTPLQPQTNNVIRHLPVAFPCCCRRCCTLLQSQVAETGTHINPNMIPSGIGKVGPKAFPRVAMDLATTVERIQQNFVICDPSLPDCPIVFASDAFLDLTEFPREEVLGRNCRFLQVRCCCCWFAVSFCENCSLRCSALLP